MHIINVNIICIKTNKRFYKKIINFNFIGLFKSYLYDF